MVFSDYSAIMILKVSVYRFNLNPRDIPETLIGLLIKANVLTLNFHENELTFKCYSEEGEES